MPVTGRSFGQERPPLTDLLKNILERYPDGGQILKELIQNADDAGAHEVKALFDAKSHGRTSLVSPDLGLFQGPALYCYNNAVFTDDDWEGLRRPMRSNKQNNPLKVGRFGIGFNSVYHITDLPSIASGNTVAFLDPHEKYFVRGQPGQIFSTQDPLLAEYFDQFAPFHQIFGCNLNQGNYYQGTLFRFPLRTRPSQLSKKIYTRDMVYTLFDSFKNEASAILMFLKNVDSISLYERGNGGRIVHLYTAKVSENSKNTVRERRQELIKEITVDWDFSVNTTFFRMEIEKECPGKPSEKSEWFVANQVGSSETRLIELARNLKLLPWIGLAFPLDANNNMSSLGRIFCFLPLPPDCRTGLPVQVNGYFGLTDNRRALKWPGPDCQNDETAEWNELLLENVGSQVYVNLILNMIRDGSSILPSDFLAQLVYSAFPVRDSVRQEWRCILQPFFQTVLAKEVFQTTASSISRWIFLGEAILDRLDETEGMREEMKQVVLRTLLSAGQPVVSLPKHVLGVIDMYHKMSGWKSLHKVTPALLCNVLRSNFGFHQLEMTFKEKLLLLEYALQNVPASISNLHGVPLLPLENGQFIKFSSESEEKIFIPSAQHSANLLPNLKHRLLCRNLPLQIQQKLNELSLDKATQLHHPTANDIKQLLWQNQPKDWVHNLHLETLCWKPNVEGHPSLKWLELVWKWINENYPKNLSEFQGMPLIPVSINPPCTMAKLRQNPTTIVSEHSLCTEVLSNAVQELLRRAGCIVIKKVPSFLKHDQLFHPFNYISLPNPSGVLRVLFVSREKVIPQVLGTSNDVKRELCSILSSLGSIDLAQKSFIRMLPIFEAVDGRCYIACETPNRKHRLVAPRKFLLPEEFRIVDRTQILSSFKDANYRLLKKLDMRMESTASLIKMHLDSFLISGIAEVEKDKLVLWILKNLEMLNREMSEFVNYFRQLPCVPIISGKRIAANKLFDHSDGLLKRLLEGNTEAFPKSQFLESILLRKNELKVRRRENLVAQDVYLMVSQTCELSLDRGNALAELTNWQPQLLNEYITDGRLLRDVLRELPWLPRVQNSPKGYPDIMPWYDGKSLCKPSSMYPDSLALIVGATAPVFNERMLSQEVQELLGMSWTQNLYKEAVDQLYFAVASWRNETTSPLILGKFEEMVKSVYMHLHKAPIGTVNLLLQSKRLTEWIWHGNGFTSPKNVALESHFPNTINLYPYLFRLPNELFKVKEFLLCHGVKPQFDVDDLLGMLWCIKKKHDDEQQTFDNVTQDLDQCRAVLEWIVRNSGELSEERQGKLLIPVQCQPGKLQLEPCNKCTYCDREFLRRGVSEHQISFKSHLIHKAIPDDLATRLKVPRLSSCLAGARSIGIKFKEAGQYEPLTTRLRNILQQYKEGVAIFKEIIQNADDARASKVCFVVDWRENPCERLLTEKLAKCQGPALWAYNDAMFSDNDFENINKLAGETKKDDLDKVGRFGLGFNSVYHLTDVPSIVSGEHMVILDPNMTHISELVDGKMRRGGVMLSLVENKDNLSAFPDQFSPYNNLFGCDMSGASDFHFNGTLFRLPFRTAKQAQESEVSKDPYTRDKLNILMKSLKESAATVLLFTQNVREVQVFEIAESSKPETSLKRPLICIRRSVEKILHTNDADRCGEGTILQNSSAWLLRSRLTKMVSRSEGPRRTELLKINVSMAKCDLYEVSQGVEAEDRWIVNSCAGSKSSLKVAQSNEGIKNAVVPVTGVAVKITESKRHGTKVLPVTGEVFCFMPLSIESGFPVHVNGSFSLYSNRRRLWEEGVSEYHSLKPFEAKWNEALMQDSLVQSCLQLLEILKSFNDEHYEFHSLWPNPTKVNYPKAWKPFLVSFFNQIIDEKWPLFYCNGSWRKLHDCLILDPKLNKVTECVTIMNLLGKNVLSLPQNFIEAFKSSGKEDFIDSHMLTEDKFLREFFFPGVSQIPNHLRDSVLVYILDRRLSKHREYDDLLLRYPSFSCSKNGQFLQKPNDLVHPNGKAACLFAAEEMRFPVDERLLEGERALMLKELGMVVDFLPWSALCERARWASNNSDIKKAGLVIQFMNKMPPQCKINEEQSETLRATKFLPILSKPKDYPFSWRSDQCRTTHLAAANNLYPERHKNLVGSSQLILDESSNVSSVPNHSLKKILGFTSKQPQLSDVIAQLDQVIQQSHVLTREKKKSICHAIYYFLQDVVIIDSTKENFLRQNLECRSWMLVNNQLVNSKLVAKNWNKEAGSPYLFSLPSEYIRKFKGLIQWYGVKQNFLLDDFTEAIKNFKKDVSRKKLSDNQIGTLIVILDEICQLTNMGRPVILPLPSMDCHLYNADELAFNDTPWLETDGTDTLVHVQVPKLLAYKCGAKELRDAYLTRCSKPIGQPFGQHEKLADRLRNILKAYPADVGILKELLQNADDAEAKEIHFVYDPRKHGSKYIFSEKWKDLQGPAICVYNDKPFSKQDIEGIQRLGIGSKVDDPMKTGQYGIGFNAVYHLTDCPYFISNDEMICVSDPHTAYAPGADEQNPGRLFNQIDEPFRRNYRDFLSGFLGDLFDLKGSTMFRFPLRFNAKFQSKISNVQWDEERVNQLFDLFRDSAKDMLLFLNNVTKISISVIKDGHLETYSTTCEVSDVGERAKFFEKVRACSKMPTQKIEFEYFSYVMKVSDTNNFNRDWLVAQSLGYLKEECERVPNGMRMGLLPRAGVAVRLKTSESTNRPLKHFIFCVLPLPVSVRFPVHINGHFALDSARRGLWYDPKSWDERVIWNDFMKRHVIPPAYAIAIFLARMHLPGYQAKSTTSGVFLSKMKAEEGLRWYHQLFPSIANLDKAWKPVGEALYRNILPSVKVLPVAMSVPESEKSLTEKLLLFLSAVNVETDQTPVNVTWCKVNDAFFCTTKMSWLLKKSLLKLGCNLLSHTPREIHECFKNAKCGQDASPKQVQIFLRDDCKIIDKLPAAIDDTVLHDARNVYEVTKYCAANDDYFFKNLQGLPLLLTQDGMLQCFGHAKVYCSRFSKLLPSRSDLFLHDSVRHLYSNNIENCSNVMRTFRIPDLAKFQEILFPLPWINNVSQQSWNPEEQPDTFPSKEWLALLWQFIDDISGKKNCQGNILKDIMDWHIIPTSNNCLTPVSKGKTVLNASTYSNSNSPQDKVIRELLVKVGCPQLNHKILTSPSSKFSRSGGTTEIFEHYLAMVQSTEDVLGLLHQNVNSNTREASLTYHEIKHLLLFLQCNLSNLRRPLLRDLPFYQTINWDYTSLGSMVNVFEVPEDIPRDDLQTLSRLTNSIFLRQAPRFAELYKYIGVKAASSVELYTSIILKNFAYLTPKGRENHLKYVRDFLLHQYRNGCEAQDLLHFMRQLPFIPDHSGVLHPAREFYDQDNKVFKVFVPKEKFPSKPFDSPDWKEFLKKVGLQFKVTKDHFLQYAKQLEDEAGKITGTTSDEAKKIMQKSSILVSHLFENEGLHTSYFASKISNIKFVPAASINTFYLDIHPPRTKSILTYFRSSVIEKHSVLVWSSASLIAKSAFPYGKCNLSQMLGVHTSPPHEYVISHVKNISARFTAAKEKEIPPTLVRILSMVMKVIYDYLNESCQLKDFHLPPDTNCSRNCKLARNALYNLPVILVDQHTFVRGSQLAFDGVGENMKPFLFNVPRHLQCFEHFLKCLGAQECPTPLQYSSVLEAIKRRCGDNQMHQGECNTAIAATKCLFKRLNKDNKYLQMRKKSTSNAVQSLESVKVLYLPTEDNYLIPSCDIFFNDTMEKKERLKGYWRELLIDLTMKDEEHPAKLLELLPNHLKVKKLSSKINEELSSSCFDKLCILDRDTAANVSSCDFIKRYREIICSPELSEALLRLYKYQEQTAKIAENVKNDLHSLEKHVKILCMQNIEVQLVKIASKEPVSGSELEVPTFCQRNHDGYCILIKHGDVGNLGVLHELLSSFIYKITGQHIRKENWRFLMMILGANDPSEISKVLDDAHVPSTISSLSKAVNLGDQIPEHFHYLLKNDIHYHLRTGEWVGYEVREEDNKNEAVYVYAKIIEQTCQGDGIFNFNSKYKIDIGKEEPIEVSKLKLYKFDRDEQISGGAIEVEDNSSSNIPDPTPPVPVTLEGAKREVAEALKEICKLPVSERSSAIKRLIRKWHPDKCMHRKSFANEVLKFLLNEVERLKEDGILGDQPNPDSLSPPGISPSKQPWKPTPLVDNENEPVSRNEAERWMRQAQDDLDAAGCLFRNAHYSLTCFHCQQAVEKGLKALMFAKGRLKKSDLEAHDVMALAYRSTGMDWRLQAVPRMVERVTRYYINTRYPQYHRGSFRSSIPAETFSQEDAADAITKAKETLQLLQQVLI